MTLSKKKFLKELSDGFEKLANDIYESSPHEVSSLSDLEYELDDVMKVKKEFGVENLYFYRDKDYSGDVLCLTGPEHLQAMGIRGSQEMLLTRSYDLRQVFESKTVRIKFPHSNNIYFGIEGLKHDLLAMRLAGIK